jgi:hypothetical protein
MQAHRRSLLALIAATGMWVAVVPETFAQTEAPPVIEGTVRISGCRVAAPDLMVRARPLRGPADWSGEVRVLRADTGETAGSFRFRFDALAAGVPYRIGVKVLGPSAQTCQRLAWSVDRDPLALPGDAPLHFSGFAVRSSLEVLATTEGRRAPEVPTDIEGDVREHLRPELWVGADVLNFRDPAKAVRRFRWRSDLPGVDGGRLQIALRPFPRINARSYDPCATGANSGVIRQADFDAVRGGWTMLPAVDFHDLLMPADPDGSTLTDSGTLAKLDLGMPIYVRVVPKVAGRMLCDPEEGGTPPEALLAGLVASLAGPPAGESKLRLGTVFYTAPDLGKQPFPGEVCYRVTRPHPLAFLVSSWDTSAYLFGKDEDISDGVIREGASFCIPAPSDDDGWFDSVVDSFGSVLSGIVDGLGKLVNFTSNLWEEIQDEAVKVVGKAITETGIVNCGEGSDCARALETGLEIALASMGVPPSLPNFDQLVDMGVDYVAVQIASEAGIPDEVANYASDKAQEFVKKAAAGMKANQAVPGLPDWLVPDLHFRHAFLTMELYGRGVQFPYLSRPGIIRNNSPIYPGAFIPLPQRLPAPGEKPILFPMVLPPNLDGLPDPPQNYDDYQKARVDKNNWVKQRYQGGCYDLVLTGLSDPGGIAPLIHASFSTEDATPCTP